METITLRETLQRPGAYAPLAMSAAPLAIVVAFALAHGVARQADEGAAAHLWQLLVGGQVPVIAYFAWRWVPRAPRRAAIVLGLHAAALLAAALPVYLLGW